MVRSRPATRWRGACVVAALLTAGGCVAASAQPPVIPLPAEVEYGNGTFTLGPRARVMTPLSDPEAQTAARFLAQLVRDSRGLKLDLRPRPHSPLADIHFERRPGHGEEGYRLGITPQGVSIEATTGAGLLYGAVTFWQLVPAGKGAVQLPVQTIRDAPAHAWRGLMLDSARHFQSPQFVKSMIDWMAIHKLNVLHWHLTDDQGWRIEIRRYPKLTSVGAWREPAVAGERNVERYGGFYTQAEIRDIVAHAESRSVQIVPEIEMPGHAQAAVAAYPELGAVQGPAQPVSARWGVHDDLFNLQPSTFEFLGNVLAEVIPLFSSRYIHVGGDEAVKDQWIASPEVQARARTLGITDMEALQTWFTQEIGQFLASRDRRLIGWDEILRPGLPADAIVMSWRGTSGAHDAAVAGNDTVLSPWPTLYFDNRQAALPSEPPGRMRVISLEDVYRFDLRDPSLTEEQQRHVLGVQGNLWTEHIRTEARLEWMALPRAAAVAEVGWTAKERRSWEPFARRLVPMLERYRALGLNYADSLFAVDARLEPADGGLRVNLGHQAGFGEIRYTTDGREPSAQSALYSMPLELPAGTKLRAATFVDGAQVSKTLQRKLDVTRRSSRELDLCSDGVALLLEPNGRGTGERPIFALDIMNPCWIWRDVDLTRGARLTAGAGQLPFNFEIGAEAQKIRIGDARTADGELEVRIGGCDGAPVATQAVTPMHAFVTQVPQITLPARQGRHDICLRFARPRLDPMWALDWVEIRP